MRVFDHKRAKQLVDDTGLKRRVIADRLGMMHTSLNQLLIGRFQPADDTVKRLADLLGVSAGELIADASRKARTA
jgi:transcriptional regulator with XRE-family HTH domain